MRTLSVILSVVIFFFCFFSWAEPVRPKLFLESGELLDLLYEMQAKKELPKAWKAELAERTPEFQRAWDANADSLNKASEELCGRRFLRSEYSVSLVLGPYIPMARQSHL